MLEELCDKFIDIDHASESSNGFPFFEVTIST